MKVICYCAYGTIIRRVSSTEELRINIKRRKVFALWLGVTNIQTKCKQAQWKYTGETKGADSKPSI